MKQVKEIRITMNSGFFAKKRESTDLIITRHGMKCYHSESDRSYLEDSLTEDWEHKFTSDSFAFDDIAALASSWDTLYPRQENLDGPEAKVLLTYEDKSQFQKTLPIDTCALLPSDRSGRALFDAILRAISKNRRYPRCLDRFGVQQIDQAKLDTYIEHLEEMDEIELEEIKDGKRPEWVKEMMFDFIPKDYEAVDQAKRILELNNPIDVLQASDYPALWAYLEKEKLFAKYIQCGFMHSLLTHLEDLLEKEIGGGTISC